MQSPTAGAQHAPRKHGQVSPGEAGVSLRTGLHELLLCGAAESRFCVLVPSLAAPCRTQAEFPASRSEGHSWWTLPGPPEDCHYGPPGGAAWPEGFFPARPTSEHRVSLLSAGCTFSPTAARSGSSAPARSAGGAGNRVTPDSTAGVPAERRRPPPTLAAQRSAETAVPRSSAAHGNRMGSVR